ncbi:MAG TPA: 4a-hydroxytetrahydrobiopterin dehydratase [Vicinamibacteria bacterium]|jgi:4a-hydroxytetrahydrobiopterin dehydratase
MSMLDDAAITQRLAALPEWKRDGAWIRRTWTFPSFTDGIAFANRVAEAAEKADHHPDILIEYKKVTLSLTSHDSGGLTDRDFRLAARLDALA